MERRTIRVFDMDLIAYQISIPEMLSVMSYIVTAKFRLILFGSWNNY